MQIYYPFGILQPQTGNPILIKNETIPGKKLSEWFPLGLILLREIDAARLFGKSVLSI